MYSLAAVRLPFWEVTGSALASHQTNRTPTLGEMVDATHQHPLKLIIEVCVDSVESAVASVLGALSLSD